MEAAAAGIPRQVGRTAQYHCIKSLHIEEVEETLALSRYSALVIKSSELSVVDPCRSRQPFRTESARHCARLDGDWYVAALPNQGHAGEDGCPQIDGCEREDEHSAAVETRGDLHLVLE